MLNYNKIDSIINYHGTVRSQLARHMGLNESTFRSRLNKHNFSPDDIEKLAIYYDKPISYFFDKDENDMVKGDCERCPVLEEQVKVLKEMNDLQRKYIRQLEGNNDKKENTLNSV